MESMPGTAEGSGRQDRSSSGTISSFVIFPSSPCEKATGLNNLELGFKRRGGWKEGRMMGCRLTSIYRSITNQSTINTCWISDLQCYQPNFYNFLKLLGEIHSGSILGWQNTTPSGRKYTQDPSWDGRTHHPQEEMTGFQTETAKRTWGREIWRVYKGSPPGQFSFPTSHTCFSFLTLDPKRTTKKLLKTKIM